MAKKKKKLSKSQKAKKEWEKKKLAKERAALNPKPKITIPKIEERAEKIAKTSIEEISKANTTKEGIRSLERTLQALQQGFKSREKAIEKSGKYSPALEGAKEYMNVYTGSIPSLRKEYKDSTSFNYRNKLIHEIAKFHTFFNNKTSSIEGIENIQQEALNRIFSSDEKIQLTENEWKAYWAGYNEYMKNNLVLALDSDQVQVVIGEVFKKHRSLFSDGEFQGMALIDLIDKEYQKTRQSSDEEYYKRFGSFGIYSGQWDYQ